MAFFRLNRSAPTSAAGGSAEAHSGPTHNAATNSAASVRERLLVAVSDLRPRGRSGQPLANARGTVSAF